ncbi:protein of unknown function [Burkholderia multivorans]
MAIVSAALDDYPKLRINAYPCRQPDSATASPPWRQVMPG